MDGEKEEYKEKIIEMVKEIENIDWLKFIHRLIINLLKQKKAKGLRITLGYFSFLPRNHVYQSF